MIGALVGCSGAILTYIMCVGMGRSLAGVLFGGLGQSKGPAMVVEGEATITSVEQTVEKLVDAQSVIIVPGYGMAVSKAQYAISEMVQDLRKAGKTVRFGIHPVAGRMP